MNSSRSTLLYAATVTVSAFLLFQVQPLVAKSILPWFGGSPSVWTVCMLFFQSVLLAGYAYSHLSIRRLPSRVQGHVHVSILIVSLVFLPIIPSESWKPGATGVPGIYLLGLLLALVGLPYFVLSSTAPLVQAWFGRHHPGRSPYRLYALSNASSLAALLSYPFLFEPNLSSNRQAYLWSGGYVLFAILSAACAWTIGRLKRGERVRAPSDDPPDADDGPPNAYRYVLWFALPCCASILLLAVTNELTQDIPSIPFLWVVPLSLYLLSFVLCFESSSWYSRLYYVPLAVGGLFLASRTSWIQHEGTGFLLDLAAWSVTLFIFCMVCHGELVLLKPGVRHLTSFYLLVAAGGAAGGAFAGLVAPRLFSSFAELPIGLFGCFLLVGIVGYRASRRFIRFRGGGAVRLILLAGYAVAVAMCGHALHMAASDPRGALVQVRNFYGVLRVEESRIEEAGYHERMMMNGGVVHGSQNMNPEDRRTTTTYYGRGSGLDLAFRHHPKRESRSIGVVGLGAGTVAALAAEGDTVRFYEINPEVIDAASSHFTYMDDTPATVVVVQGDARLSLEREEPQAFDLLVLDAFSGDAIPVHLLTLEAFETYLGHLAPGGVIAVNISSHYFDLHRVLWAAADRFGLAQAFIQSDKDEEAGIYEADWLLLSRNDGPLDHPEIRGAATARDDGTRVETWTDSYSSLFRIIRKD